MAEITGPFSNLLRVHMQHTLSFPAVLSSDNQKCGKLHLPTLSANPCYETQESSKVYHEGLGRDTIADVAKKAASAVVTIHVFDQVSEGMCSGIIIREDGLILTCAHEISQGGQDGKRYKSRLVVAYLDLDIALLKIISPTKNEFAKAKIGSASKLLPGHLVIAIGCPLSLTYSVTMGIISSEWRPSSKLLEKGVERDFMQMDCSIAQGNSGGPLFNIDRELVGITVFCSKTAPGMGFAIPIDNILALLGPMLERNAVQPESGWIIYDFYGMMINQKDPSFPNKQGVCVIKVRGGSSAERAGIKQGDLILKFNDVLIRGDIRKIMHVLKEKYGQMISVTLKGQEGAATRVDPDPENHHAPRISNLPRSKM